MPVLEEFHCSTLTEPKKEELGRKCPVKQMKYRQSFYKHVTCVNSKASKMARRETTVDRKE